MPKKAKELSALAVSRLKDPGRYAVGGVDGLHLRIIGNSKSWTLRVKVGDRRCDIGLGPYPEVSLSDAREAARVHRKKVREGVDPLQERQQARAALRIERAKSKTFRDCADAYIEAHKAGYAWRLHDRSDELGFARAQNEHSDYADHGSNRIYLSFRARGYVRDRSI